MSIWNRFGGWLRGSRSNLSTPDPWLIEAWGGPSSLAGVRVNADSAMKSTAVYACVRLLAETVASLPLHLYRRGADGRKERDTSHPLYRLLHDQPNPLMSSSDLFEMSMAAIALRGNAYVRIVRGWDGMVRELIPIHPDRVEIKSAADGRSLLYGIDGGKEVLRTGQVWHMRGFTLDGLRGVSPITYAREAIGLALAAEAHGARVFQNAARPSGILTHPGKLSKEAKANLSESWRAAHSGENYGRAAVLEEDVRWTQLSVSLEDAKFIETRVFQLREIARIFRCPPHMIGDLERSTFSNIEHQSIDFVRHTIRPPLVRIEQSIWRDLLLPFEQREYAAEFNLEGLLRGDTKSRYEAHGLSIRDGWRSPNEVRAIESENPREGGDIYLTPLNMTPSRSEGETNASPEA